MPTLKIPYFDDVEVEVDYAGNNGGCPLTNTEAAAALKAFLSLTTADRLSDSRHVYAYYQDFREYVGGEDWMDEELGVPDSPEAIWKHVTPKSLFVDKDGNGGERYYVIIECECGWESEHGLMMVWRDGRTLSKVGGYDGHLTNASGDDGLEDVVYLGLDARFHTRLRI